MYFQIKDDSKDSIRDTHKAAAHLTRIAIGVKKMRNDIYNDDDNTLIKPYIDHLMRNLSNNKICLRALQNGNLTVMADRDTFMILLAAGFVPCEWDQYSVNETFDHFLNELVSLDSDHFISLGGFHRHDQWKIKMNFSAQAIEKLIAVIKDRDHRYEEGNKKKPESWPGQHAGLYPLNYPPFDLRDLATYKDIWDDLEDGIKLRMEKMFKSSDSENNNQSGNEQKQLSSNSPQNSPRTILGKNANVLNDSSISNSVPDSTLQCSS